MIKKYGPFIFIAAAVCGMRAHAADAYPAYTGYVPVNNYVPANVNVPYVPSTSVTQLAAQIPGSIVAQPRVASTAAAQPTIQYPAQPAARYYEPAAQQDASPPTGGMYIGLSAAYNISLSGGITADYASENGSYAVPGAFQQANLRKDTILPIQISAGGNIGSDFRADLSYTRYSGISYPNTVQTADGIGGFVTASATGGAITANAAMLNVYYNLDSLTGSLGGGAIRPYIGAGAGISVNTISDYVVYDPNYYQFYPDGASLAPGTPAAISDIYAYHAGGTMEQFAYMLEGGVTAAFGGNLLADFFVRYSGLGRVQSSGNITVTQTEWLATELDTIPRPGSLDLHDVTQQYLNWRESGRLGLIDIGVRLRIQF
ncbi:MAG: hypothetical protein FWC61_02320 [Proteobacteria bacterium]|nr:hypothetical protein [Pseudomonadota bacterium]